MNQNSVLPFERNRYYSGKMLTSVDFAAEQEYMNNKRRFINNLMFGAGVVCGLNVYSLDDLSLFVESGFAIDRFGREIVIENSVVKKLSAIEGFDQSESNELTLCLRYVEENVQQVYSLNRKQVDSEYEYNRVKEGYELFFLPTVQIGSKAGLEEEFLTNGVIYEDNDYSVVLEAPATVCINNSTMLKVVVSKKSASDKELSFDGVLQVPAFTSENDSHDIRISFDKLTLEKGESISKEYWVYVNDIKTNETTLSLKNGICEVEIAGDIKEIESNLSMRLLIEDINPRTLVDREIGKTSLELYNMGESGDYIPLADVVLIRTDSAYIIDKINERNVKKYIETPAKNIVRNEYLNYFKKDDVSAIYKTNVMENTPVSSAFERDGNRIKVATGIVEIPIGDKAKAGTVYYSGEIMHGLGMGAVYVEVGSEILENSSVTGANGKSTIYGNASLFKTGKKNVVSAQTAVKVLNDKGSFVVAAKFDNDCDCLMLTYRWVAIKLASNADYRDDLDEKQWLEAETPTIVLGTSESVYLGVKFHNMEKCSIDYSVLEKNSGEVTIDGIYTAPNREGVYEVKISCVEKPYIYTYVYVIVKKK